LTKFEKYMYDRRINEFFGRIYENKFIATIHSNDCSERAVCIIRNEFVLLDAHTEPTVLAPVATTTIDILADAFAKGDIESVEHFIKSEVKSNSDIHDFDLYLYDRNVPQYYTENALNDLTITT